MITKQLVLAGCTALLLSVATAYAGPCNIDGKSDQDAGPDPHQAKPARPLAAPVPHLLSTPRPTL